MPSRPMPPMGARVYWCRGSSGSSLTPGSSGVGNLRLDHVSTRQGVYKGKLSVRQRKSIANMPCSFSWIVVRVWYVSKVHFGTHCCKYILKAWCGNILSFTDITFSNEIATSLHRHSVLLIKLYCTQTKMCGNLISVNIYHLCITKLKCLGLFSSY